MQSEISVRSWQKGDIIKVAAFGKISVAVAPQSHEFKYSSGFQLWLALTERIGVIKDERQNRDYCSDLGVVYTKKTQN